MALGQVHEKIDAHYWFFHIAICNAWSTASPSHDFSNELDGCTLDKKNINLVSQF